MSVRVATARQVSGGWRSAGCVAMVLLAACSSSSRPTPPTSPTPTETAGPQSEPRIVVMVLDAVPYETLRRMVDTARRRGDSLFGEMQEPLPLVSSFPSTTTVSLAGTFMPLGMKQPPGYEARFFDWEQRRVRGGGPISYNRIETYWADFFHWHVENPLRKGFGFLRPRKFARFEMRRGLEEFLASDRRVFLTYVSATDGAGHLHGPASLEPLLLTLDQELRRARQRQPFVTVLLSDHGMERAPPSSAPGVSGETASPRTDARNADLPKPLLNLRRNIQQSLADAGFRLRQRLERESDVVWVRYGLLTSAVFFTNEDQRTEVARTLAAIHGVDVCALQDGPDSFTVWGRDEDGELARARITGSDGISESTVSSLRLTGDRAVLGDDLPYDETLSAASWLQRTASAQRPDAPYRIARAFDLVANPASVICSIEAGYMVGSWLTDWSGRLTVGKLRYTHGSLSRAASLGFFITDAPWFSSAGRSALRFDEALIDVLPAGWQRSFDDASQPEAAAASATDAAARSVQLGDPP